MLTKEQRASGYETLCYKKDGSRDTVAAVFCYTFFFRSSLNSRKKADIIS